MLCRRAEIVCPQADGAEALLDPLPCLHTHAPVRDLDRMLIHAPGANYVFAAGQNRCADAAGVGKECLGGLDGQKPPLVHDGD